MNNKKNTVLLIVLVFSILAMSIAYAALSTNLRISGTASVPNVNWNIHFQNWALDTASTVTYGGNTHQNTAVYPTVNELSQSLSPNITKVEDLNITLYQPGDYAKYTFQIKNDGTINASLDNFEKTLTCASGEDCSHLSYTIKCSDSVNGVNNLLEVGSSLPANGIAYCSLEVKYSDQTNQNSGNAGQVQTYTQTAAHATLDATWTYSQFKNYFSYQSYNGTSNATPATYFYLRTNTTTNEKEVCGVFPNGTTCIAGSSDGYTLTSGYAKAKADEMAANGATCSLDSSLVCSSQNVICYFRPDGVVGCYLQGHQCTIVGDASNCW